MWRHGPVRGVLPLILIGVAALGAACGGGDTVDPEPAPPPPPPPANRAPTAGEAIPDQAVVEGQTVRIDLSASFSDPDGDTLTHVATTSNPAVATVGLSGTELSVTGGARGAAAVTVRVSDPDGLSAAQSFAVEVAAPAPTTVTAGTAPTTPTTVTVAIGADDASGAGDVDFEGGSPTPASVEVPIAAGKKSGTAKVMIDAADDAERDEKNEMIALTSSGTEQGVYYAPGSIDITDDDPDIDLELNVTEVNEDAGTVTVVITGTTDTPVGGILNFSIALGGTASRGDVDSTADTFDYRAPENVALQFNTGGTTASATVTLVIVDDGDDEANETIIFDDADGVQVAGAGKTYTVGPETLTIVDNDDN